MSDVGLTNEQMSHPEAIATAFEVKYADWLLPTSTLWFLATQTS